MKLAHIRGLILRDFFVVRRSWHRITNLFFSSMIQLFLWGFVSLWLKEDILNPNPQVNVLVLLLGALIFWELFWRIQEGVAVAFLEEVWARNVINLFAAPFSQKELVAGFFTVSTIKGAVSFALVIGLAFTLYALEVWDLGLYLLPFILNLLLFGWVLGIVSVALISRFGPSFQELAWAIPFFFQPFSAVFYPVSVLPEFVGKAVFFLPTSHLFEGMRSVLLEGIFSLEHIVWATLLNLVYLAFALLFFAWMIRIAKKRGLIARFIVN